MLQTLSSDRVVLKIAVGGAVNRVERSPSSATGVELNDRAVTPVMVLQKDPVKHDLLAVPAQALARIRDEFDKIAMAEDDRRKLDEIIGKLLPGYRALMERYESPAAIKDAENAVAEFQVLRDRLLGSSSTVVSQQASGSPAPAVATGTLAQIEDAFRGMGELSGALATARAGAHERLLDIAVPAENASAAGASVAGNDDMTRSVVAARDLVMANLRALGAAHGRVSPGMARLVLR